MTRLPARLLVVLLVAVALYRASLLDRGTSAFVDETLYFTSVMAVRALAAGEVREAAAHIADARGRQGAALLQLPVAMLQGIPSAFGVPASNPRSLLIPTAFNVLISLFTLVLLHATARALVRDEAAAFTATAVYALLVNTNLYVRHVLPYEWALCAGLLALWIVVTRPASARTSALAGAVAGAVITLYAGYYLFAVVLGVGTVLQCRASLGTRAAAGCGVAFAAGVALILGAVEAICRIGGVSYIASSRALGGTIAMGSFDEGWSFLPEYLFQVEGPSGVVLLVSLGVWGVRALLRVVRRRTASVDRWVAAGIAGWGVQAVLAAELELMVFYGRLLRPWFVVLALALADALAASRGSRFRIAVHTLVLTAAVAAFVPAARAYRQLAYPSDVLYTLGIDTSRIPPEQTACEFAPGTPYASPGPLNRETGVPYTDEGDYVLINVCQSFSSARAPLDVNPGERPLLYDGPHWLTFPAYTFEGFEPAGRQDMRRGEYRVRVFGPAAQ